MHRKSTRKPPPGKTWSNPQTQRLLAALKAKGIQPIPSVPPKPQKKTMHRTDPKFLHIPGDPLLGLTVNLPAALTGKHLHGLPPYAPIAGYAVDDYELCPASWPRTSGITASYFVTAKDGHGMWLDFNRVCSHDRHVAVVVSIQGINPLTGRKTDKLELERYPDDPSTEEWLRGYQNYLATSATPGMMMWIDGFRGEDGKVRQYVFTKDEKRGVAAQLIGDDRVFSIGAAFFVSKEPKPPQERYTTVQVHHHDYFSEVLGKKSLGPDLVSWVGTDGNGANYSSSTKGSGDMLIGSSLQDRVRSRSAKASARGFLRSMSVPVVQSSVEEHCLFAAQVDGPEGAVGPSGAEGVDGALMADRLEIAAGEEICQRLYRDHNPIDFWLPAAVGVVVVNYASEAVVGKILAGARAKPKAGFLDKVTVGNGE